MFYWILGQSKMGKMRHNVNHMLLQGSAAFWIVACTVLHDMNILTWKQNLALPHPVKCLAVIIQSDATVSGNANSRCYI